jgi:hypothetical protein
MLVDTPPAKQEAVKPSHRGTSVPQPENSGSSCAISVPLQRGDSSCESAAAIKIIMVQRTFKFSLS